MADLERVLQQLHDREINAGVQTFYDAGMRAWIGDSRAQRGALSNVLKVRLVEAKQLIRIPK
jgi:hypothetical protein